ncbi:hypothetical protein GC176_05975 [bacterium]|nr:hypothetical protein [bacterium]
MSPQDRFEELWTDYLEGELDQAGVAELQELLASDDGLLKQAADLFQTHRMLGLVAAEEVARHEQFVAKTLTQLPTDGDSFVVGVMGQVQKWDRHPVCHQAPVKTSSDRQARIPAGRRRRSVIRSLIAVAGLVLALLISWPFWMVPTSDVSADETVHLASQSHAKFFGELSPPVGSSLSRQRDYVLMSGLVELAFPKGASAIIEGPAVFRVASAESLALDVGRCSVHAPDGAEGFRIETPVTRVVDRGTRFTVNVSETSETEVQVVEGAADIYERRESPRGRAGSGVVDESAVRLTANNAQKFAHVGEFTADTIPFDVARYRRRLPDRVVSYKATTGRDGDAEELISVTVQRDGVVCEIPVEELIPVEVTWFRGESGAFLCSGRTLPAQRRDLTADRSLVTGVINPGGSEEPLTADPSLDPEAGTPGMAIRFQSPVMNGPGADLVLFDLQTFANPPDGDAFHISPLKFRPGLHSHTIRVFDLTMESPSALDLTDFDVFMFGQPVRSITELESVDCTPRRQVVKFRGLAVGIDLSDLGYSIGDHVEELFLQDALDDQHFIDPVFIGGFPAQK